MIELSGGAPCPSMSSSEDRKFEMATHVSEIVVSDVEVIVVSGAGGEVRLESSLKLFLYEMELCTPLN